MYDNYGVNLVHWIDTGCTQATIIVTVDLEGVQGGSTIWINPVESWKRETSHLPAVQ